MLLTEKKVALLANHDIIYQEVNMNILETSLWDRDEDLQSDTNKQQFEEKILYNEQEIEYDLDDIEEDVEKEVSVIDNARIRLEQGRLYEMLIKHNLFEGVEAMPQAVSKVQSEIKEFIVERLEILLGMKAEKEKKQNVQQVVLQSQFNELEVQALKMIASKVTKGASENTQTLDTKPKNELNAIKNTVSNKNSLNTIKTNEPQKRAPVTTNKKQVTQKPIQNKQPPIVDEDNRSLSPEALAKKDMKYIESLQKMPLEDANKIVSQRHTRPMSTKKIDLDSAHARYANRIATNQEAQAFAALLAKAKRK